MAKYHAAITPEVAILNKPLASPHVHSHTSTTAQIAQSAQPSTCHSLSLPPPYVKCPTSSSRKMSVTNGIDMSRAARRTAGDSARRKGLRYRRSVVVISSADVVCMSRGRLTRRRAVSRESTSGISEKSRRLDADQTSIATSDDVVTHPHVSPQVGVEPPSHIKLPTNAHMAEMKSVAGTKTEVAITTGLTKTRRSKI